jgi:hypothetical protein
VAYFDLPLDQLWSYCPPQTRQPDCAQFWRDTLAEVVPVQIRFPDAPPRTGTPHGHPGHSGPVHAGAAFVRCRRVRLAGWQVGTFSRPAVVQRAFPGVAPHGCMVSGAWVGMCCLCRRAVGTWDAARVRTPYHGATKKGVSVGFPIAYHWFPWYTHGQRKTTRTVPPARGCAWYSHMCCAWTILARLVPSCKMV